MNAVSLSYFAKTPLDLLSSALRVNDQNAVLATLAQAFDTAASYNGGALQEADMQRFRRGGELLRQHEAGLALIFYASVLKSNPGFAPAWTMLGLCLGQHGQLRAECLCHQRALALQPDFAEGYYCLATALKRLGDLEPATEAAFRAVSLHPNYGNAWSLLGGLYSAKRQLKDAAAAYGAAAETLDAPLDKARAWLRRGNILQSLDLIPDALSAYRAALALHPDYPEALTNLGCALHAAGQPEDAVACCQDAVRLSPGLSDAHRNLGVALHTLGRFSEAAEAYRAALRLRPDDADVLSYMGAALTDMNQAEQAEPLYEAALAIAPESPEIHFNHSLALLKSGRMADGWPEHEWRWQGLMPPHGLGIPQWEGEPLHHRRILLHAEQGLGDTLQFMRYAPLVGLAAHVVLEVQAPLVRLARSLPNVAQVIAVGEPRPECDLHCPMMSLPHVFGTTAETIPPLMPYLSPDPDLLAQWQNMVPALPMLKVGLVWAGKARKNDVRTEYTDRRRSMALSHLAPLGKVPGICWFNLQMDEPAAQLMQAPAGMKMIDLTSKISDFADTAALIQNLDLVIAVDTSVVHLAGAMNRPVWMLSRFDSCWRWMQDVDQSAWYPSLRIYRQSEPGDWQPVVAHVAADLAALVNQPA